MLLSLQCTILTKRTLKKYKQENEWKKKNKQQNREVIVRYRRFPTYLDCFVSSVSSPFTFTSMINVPV